MITVASKKTVKVTITHTFIPIALTFLSRRDGRILLFPRYAAPHRVVFPTYC